MAAPCLRVCSETCTETWPLLSLSREIPMSSQPTAALTWRPWSWTTSETRLNFLHVMRQAFYRLETMWQAVQKCWKQCVQSHEPTFCIPLQPLLVLRTQKASRLDSSSSHWICVQNLYIGCITQAVYSVKICTNFMEVLPITATTYDL